MAIDNDTGKPYVRVRLTPELFEMLERWKEYSGTDYSNTVRWALMEYLGERLKDVPRKREIHSPDKKEESNQTAHAQEFLKQFSAELMGHVRERHGGDYMAARLEISNAIASHEKEFKQAGYAQKIETVLDLTVYGDVASNSIKDYAKGLLEPLSRRRGKSKG